MDKVIRITLADPKESDSMAEFRKKQNSPYWTHRLRFYSKSTNALVWFEHPPVYTLEVLRQVKNLKQYPWRWKVEYALEGGKERT